MVPARLWRESMSGVVVSIVGGFLQRMIQIGWIWALLVPVELLWPLGAQVSWVARLRGVTLSTLYFLSTAIFAVAIGSGLRAAGLAPIFNVAFTPAPGVQHALYIAGSTALSVMVFDFFYYWLHRAQHRWWWRFHAVHHAIEDLSAVNTYWHWTEELFRAPLLTIPVLLLTPAGMEVLPWAAGVVTLQSYFVHSQTRVHLGPLWRVVMDNRFHRVHHSIDPVHHDRNFGVLTPVWDWMFGTLYVPAKGEWPATGLADAPEVDGLVDYLWRPFRGRPAPAPVLVD
jgi:sterol desaturase/sphingolipid hydroxylase (fatty acid hydroxylase superfamily)